MMRYLLPTIEGKDGKASMKRITILLFVILFTVAFFSDLVWDATVSDVIMELLTTVIVVGILGNHAEAIITRKSDATDQQEHNPGGGV